MDLVVFDEGEAPCALRALREVVASNGTITPAESRASPASARCSRRSRGGKTRRSPGGSSRSACCPRARWGGLLGSTRNRFAFPGEKGGIPERMVYHDFGHVLAGYDTTPEGEIQQGAFQAGFTREDGFAFLMFAIIQFHLGVKVTPVTGGRTGLFDVAKVLRAARRGSACTVDLSDAWDPFPVADRPLEQVRADYGIPALD